MCEEQNVHGGYVGKQRSVAERIEDVGLDVSSVVALALAGKWLGSPERTRVLDNAAHGRATARRLDFLEMHFVHHKSLDEIADEMGISVPGLNAIEANFARDLRINWRDLPRRPEALRSPASLTKAVAARKRASDMDVDVSRCLSLAERGAWADSPERAELESAGRSRRVTGLLRRMDFIDQHYGHQRPVREIAADWSMTPQHLYMLDQRLTDDLGVDCSHLPALLEQHRASADVGVLAGAVDVLSTEPDLTPVTLAARLGVPARTLRERLGPALYEFAFPALISGARGRSVSISDDAMLNAIRRAHAKAGKGDTLSANAYNAVRYGNEDDFPFSLTITKRFGSWSAAVERAGLQANAPTRAALDDPDSDHLILVVADFLLEATRVTIGDYQEWARSRGDAPLQVHTTTKRPWTELLRAAQQHFLPGGVRHDGYLARLNDLAGVRRGELLGAAQ